MDVYAIKYRLNLFSNFTFFLDNPASGDQFEQADHRTVVGMTPRWVFNGKWDERQVTNKLGVDARRDDINVALYNTQARERVDVPTPSTVRSDKVLQTGVGVYYENAIQWSDTFRSIAGVRKDFYGARVDSDNPANSGTTNAHLTSPKLNFIFGPFGKTEYFLNYGQGFHSNDARGTTITVDPKDPTSPTPPMKVPALVKTRGEEIGMRTEVIPHLQSSLSLWRLALDSELVFKGDAGTTEASRPSLRRGIEWSSRYIPHNWLLVDLDLSASRAQFTDGDPKGSYIPGAIDRVASLGVTAKDFGPWSWTVHARYFGPRPLIEDNSQRSQSSTIFSARASYKVDARTSVNFDVFNLFNRKANDIEYFYSSRLCTNQVGTTCTDPPPGQAPKDDIHFHPAEPRTVRLALVARY